jgi:hypothetical protein
MATLGGTTYAWPTLLDVAKRTDPNGSIPTVAEILTHYNPVMDIIPWKEGNLPTGHQNTVRTSKPTPTFRLLNQGVTPAKSSTGQIVDTCALLESRSFIDVDVAELNGNTAAFRMSESKAFIQGMMDTWAATMITGDTSVDPEKFNGLASRYFSLGTTFTTSSQLIDGGGTGSDNTSIWLVGFGPETVFGIYPKGSQAGLQVIDRGIQTVQDPNNSGTYFDAYETVFKWKGGISIKDYRYVARICNIDVSNLLTASDGSDSSANILKYMSQAIDLLPPDGTGIRPVFLMTRKALSMLRVKMINKSNVYLGLGDLYQESVPRGQKPLTFMGIPCLRCDEISEAESTILTSTT